VSWLRGSFGIAITSGLLAQLRTWLAVAAGVGAKAQIVVFANDNKAHLESVARNADCHRTACLASQGRVLCAGERCAAIFVIGESSLR
jgi:hypothetical protein